MREFGVFVLNTRCRQWTRMDVEGWPHDLVDKVDGQEKLCDLNKAACYLRFEEYEQATTSCGAVLKKHVRM